jgi:hypothetical protein
MPPGLALVTDVTVDAAAGMIRPELTVNELSVSDACGMILAQNTAGCC